MEKKQIINKIIKYTKIFLMLIGLFFLLAVILFYFIDINYVSFLGEYKFTQFANEKIKDEHQDLRLIALNITEECSSNSYCYALGIYNTLKDLRYVPTSKYQLLFSPLYTYKNGGDCKNFAILVKGLMETIGFDCFIECNLEHCVNVIPIVDHITEDYYNEVIILDIAQNKYFKIFKEENFWEDYY